MERVGVVIPCYNHAEFLGEALESVYWQTVQPYHVVVVDDGSDDFPGVLSVMARFDLVSQRDWDMEHTRQENQGPSSARNKGVFMLIENGCDLILPLDADDVLERTMIEDGLAVLEQGYDIAYPDCTYFGARRGPCRFPVRTSQGELLREMLRNNEMVNACLFRREVLDRGKEKNGEGYDTALKDWGWEDWLFWLEALLLGFKAKGIHKPLLRYRVSEGSRVFMSNEKGGLCWKHFQRKLMELYDIELEDRNASSPAEGSLLGRVRCPA